MRVLLILLLLGLSASVAFAGPRGVVWTHDGADGFKIYKHLGDSAEEVMLIDGESRRADLDVPDDDKCHTYMITAYNGDAETGPESAYSAPLSICPEKVLPEVEAAPGAVIYFTLSGTAEVRSQ